MKKSILALILIGQATVELKRLKEKEDFGSQRADDIENKLFQDLQEIYDYENDDDFVHFNLKASSEERIERLIDTLIEFYGL